MLLIWPPAAGPYPSLTGMDSEKELDTLPIDLEKCSRDTARALLASAKIVLCTPPAPLGDRRWETKQGTEKLPEGAPSLVGVSGKSRSGKDTVARILVAKYKGVAQVSFSDGIIKETNDWLRSFGREITEANKSMPMYRNLLQTWGAARREEDAKYWTRSLQKQIKELWQGGAEMVVATGVRAKSDLEAIEEMGGVHWRVVRPGNTYSEEHSIEQELDDLPPGSVETIENISEGEPLVLENRIVELISQPRG